ncbi:hypothetical protein ACS3UN_12985 [Oscillospiraceae bacterium LTW-04]|nr:hypothetical protein RBH76_00795 [Oscillospiraceae bacterium MB24-C1]
MNFALIGPGQLGRVIFHAATGQRLVIGRNAAEAQVVCPNAELGYSTQLQSAAQCQIVAVALPAHACEEVFDSLCSFMPPESILLNFSTSWDIPKALRERFPSLYLLDSKVVGSALGMARGMKSLIVLGSTDEHTTGKVQMSLPGLTIQMGDYRLVKKVNTVATKTALAAALALEKELSEQGIPSEMVKAATEGLMPGVLISYSQGTLGEFAKSMINTLKNESR